MGLSPAEAISGDLVCIIMGTDKPILLRRVEYYYIFIGAVYFHGLVEAEVILKMIEESRIPLKEFRIK